MQQARLQTDPRPLPPAAALPRWANRSCLGLALALAALLGLGSTSLLQAAIPGANPLRKPEAPSTNAPGVAYVDAQAIALGEAELRAKLQETTNALASLLQSPRPTAEPEADAAAELRRFVSEAVKNYQLQLNNLRRLREVREVARERRLELESWTRFTEPPPYSLRLIDSLRQRRDSLHHERELLEKEQRLLDSRLDGKRAAAAAANRMLRQVDEQIESTSDAAALALLRSERERRNWQVRAAESSLAAELLWSATNQEELEALVPAEDLVLRELRIASANWVLNPASKNERLAELAHRRDLVAREIDEAIGQEILASQALHDARTKLDAARASTPVNPASNASDPTLDYLRQIAEVRRVQSDASSTRLETLQWQLYLLTALQKLWEDRATFSTSTDAQAIRQRRAECLANIGQARLWIDYVQTRQVGVRDLLDAQRQRLTNWKPAEGDLAVAQELSAAYQQEDRAFSRLLDALRESLTLASYLLEDLDTRGAGVPWRSRLTSAASQGVAFLQALWNFEIASYDDSIVVEGRTIVGKRSVTLGKVLRVILTVAFGLWLSGRIAAWASRRIARKLHFDASRALLIERTFYLSLVSLVIIMALSATRIPFTAFAFLGGALAIGVGFGAQNLINNFISGLMLLLERKIKLGDIVEVDQERGVIEKVGARSSLIRRADGRELIVPNSSFLEKNVVNWTLSDHQVRVSISIGLAYGSPTRTAAEIMTRVAAENPNVLKTPPPQVLFEEFGENALGFTLHVWISLAWAGIDMRVVASDLRHRLVEALTEAGISIAFPQRDVHLDTLKPLQVEVLPSAGHSTDRTT